mmetsp:Transcript_41542/g.81675  ORF Transcript_41542/g.81675 Transcript_41542/m.81675 type:complete len:260 (+) Transcript_41542:1165-1944(+)
MAARFFISACKVAASLNLALLPLPLSKLPEPSALPSELSCLKSMNPNRSLSLPPPPTPPQPLVPLASLRTLELLIEAEAAEVEDWSLVRVSGMGGGGPSSGHGSGSCASSGGVREFLANDEGTRDTVCTFWPSLTRRSSLAGPVGAFTGPCAGEDCTELGADFSNALSHDTWSTNPFDCVNSTLLLASSASSSAALPAGLPWCSESWSDSPSWVEGRKGTMGTKAKAGWTWESKNPNQLGGPARATYHTQLLTWSLLNP